MVEIEFKYFQDEIKVQVNLDDYFTLAKNRFYQKSRLMENSVLFLHNTFSIDETKTIKEIMNSNEKFKKSMRIDVFPLYIEKNENLITESKEIICPKCSEQCRIKIENYFINFFDCKNNHHIIIPLDKFKESQKIDLSKIKCNICHIKNMGNTSDNNIFYCRNCKINICILCREKHNKNHSIILYKQKNYICPMHNDSYYKYCYNCKMNICMLCSQSHLNHKLESFDNIIADPDSKRTELDKLKNQIDIFNSNVKKIIKGLNQLIENMETYYNIFNDIFNNYDVKDKNYQVLKNINQINSNTNIYKEIYEINQSKNYGDKINKILYIYYKMKGKNDLDPFGFYKSNSKEKNNMAENTLQLFSYVPSYIKKQSKISKDSIYRCNYCPYTPLMKIMYKGYKIYMEYRCQNGHYSYEKLYDFYQRNKINSINSAICCVGYEINDGSQNFYYCNDCKKYYCERDKKAHEKLNDLPHNLIDLKYIDNICIEHLNVINDYCLDCHKNICSRCKNHSQHRKVNISSLNISDEKLFEYKNKLNKLKGDYNNFYNECDKTIKEVLDFIENFNENLIKFKKVNDYSFNICEDLLNSYQYLKSKNALNYEVFENINSILNFNDIKFNMDKNFHCIARLIYINSIIKLEYNTLFKLKDNFINFDFQITEEEEALIISKNKNINDNLEYQKFYDKNFENTYYGFFKYDPDGNERQYDINGFGIKLNKNYKYVGEFKDGKCHGYGIYYFESGAFKLAKIDRDTTQAFKLYTLSGQVEFCKYTKIIDKYQKNGLYYIEMTNGTKKINIVKSNNFDDYGIMYNINGEFYEGYHLSGVRHGYGIMNSHAENKIKTGLFYKGELQFGSSKYKDWLSQGEYDMGLKNGYIIEYDELKRIQFEGQFKNGKREGIGINYYDNGNISYKGYFINNLEDKFGFMYNSSGRVFYAGNIDKGQKRGFGIYYAYDHQGNKLYQYSGNWVDDDKCDGYLLKKFPDGDYFFGYTKMFVYQNFMIFKLGIRRYIGETKVSSTKREGYGETSYSNGEIKKGIYINDVLEYRTNH